MQTKKKAIANRGGNSYRSVPPDQLEASSAISTQLTHAAAFESAFRELIGQLEGDLTRFSIHRNQIIDLAQTDPYKAAVFVRSMIPPTDWRWPEYERQFPPDDSASDWSPLRDLSMKELRQMAGTRAKGRSIDKLVDAMQTAFHPEEFARMQQKANALVEERVATERFRNRAQMFAHRLAMLGFGAANKSQIRNSVQHVPGLKVKFLSNESLTTPKRCKSMNRKVFTLDCHEFRTMAPCSRLDCGCCWLPNVPRTRTDKKGPKLP